MLYLVGDSDGKQDKPLYFQCRGEFGRLQSNIGPQGLSKSFFETLRTFLYWQLTVQSLYNRPIVCQPRFRSSFAKTSSAQTMLKLVSGLSQFSAEFGDGCVLPS